VRPEAARQMQSPGSVVYFVLKLIGGLGLNFLCACDVLHVSFGR
jgi:hypothetical protein